MIRLWRLTRVPYVALDGAGAERSGGRYTPPGVPVVPLASEAGLAVLVALRYLPRDLVGIAEDYVLGWTEVDALPLRLDDSRGEQAIRDQAAHWLEERVHLLAAVRSKVLPEADVVLLNPRHPDSTKVAPLTTRPFDFAQCLHVPPMLGAFSSKG